MPKISDLPTDTAPASTDLIPFVDVDAARTESVTVANLAASTAFAGQYAPVAIDQFVDPFPAWFGGGDVNDGIADIVTHMDAYVGTGSGAPNGVVTGNVGDRYIDTAATLGARVWYKASGAATNTGWLVAEGDTGWRSVTLINGWTGTLLLRRVGAVCSLEFVSLDPAAATNQALYTLTSGFQNRLRTSAAVSKSTSATTPTTSGLVFLPGSGGSYQVRSPNSGDPIHGSITWITADAWPSSLPGSAA